MKYQGHARQGCTNARTDKNDMSALVCITSIDILVFSSGYIDPHAWTLLQQPQRVFMCAHDEKSAHLPVMRWTLEPSSHAAPVWRHTKGSTSNHCTPSSGAARFNSPSLLLRDVSDLQSLFKLLMSPLHRNGR